VEVDKNYIDNQINWVKKHFDSEIKSIRAAASKEGKTNKEAVRKVEANYKSYREQQNEWRETLKDQSNNFVTRKELWGAVVTIITLILAGIAILVTYK